MEFNIMQIAWFMFLGLLGGATYVMINSDGWGELTEFNSVRRYVLGIISGFIYDLLYSEYNFPNFIMAFVSGYMGTTFIEGLIKRFTDEETTKN